MTTPENDPEGGERKQKRSDFPTETETGNPIRPLGPEQPNPSGRADGGDEYEDERNRFDLGVTDNETRAKLAQEIPVEKEVAVAQQGEGKDEGEQDKKDEE